MAFWPVPPQQPAEHLQQNQWNWSRGQRPWVDQGPRRTFPVEEPFIQYFPKGGWHPGGWHKGNRHIPNFKPKYYWTRPNDGKRSGTFGRIKDALTGEGPDVFVTITGDKRTLMRDRPQRWQWTGWPEDPSRKYERRYFDRDAIEAEFMDPIPTSWTNNRGGGRYNFKTRQYGPSQMGWAHPHNVWMNAQWKPAAKRSAMNPLSHQTAEGQWWSTVPWNAGYYPGGRPGRQ